MDEKSYENAKPRITASRARHIRRKRLLSARRAAENDSPTLSNGTKVELRKTNDSKTVDDRNSNEYLSKSKARRLRKKNQTKANNSGVDSTSDIPEAIQKVCIPASNPESFESKSDIIELNSLTKSSQPTKASVTEHELLENEKNLKISEYSRSAATTSSTNGTTRNVSSGFKRDLDIFDSIIETLANSPESPKREAEASDEASWQVLMKDCSNEVSKITPIPKATLHETKMDPQEKTREQIKAEREAKKAAKAAAKAKSKAPKSETAEKAASTSQESIKKPIQASKPKQADDDIVEMTNKLTISEKQKTPEKVSNPTMTEAKSEGKSKAELRAERRAKQEAQRAAKQVQTKENIKPKANNMEPVKLIITTTKLEDIPTSKMKPTVVKKNIHEISLFKHLYHEREQSLVKMPTVNYHLHPAIVRLGVQYASKVIIGSNARCVALLAATKRLIEDFERPHQADFTRGLEASLQESSAYLHHCRPLAVSMQNALRHIKWQMTQLPTTISDKDAKTKLGNAIDTYIQEQIQLAGKAISIMSQTKISNGDVILTYGYSSLINTILCDAHDAGRQFRVVIVDGRPWLEGREQVRRLAKHGLECSYVLVNALSFIMPQVSKVFLGAHAILANGAVMSRAGTAQVALMAKAYNVPVLVACETHKTCERVQTDSIVYNELADPDELAQNTMGSSKKTTLVNWQAKKSLNLLNITYDVTPADLVTAVVTELAILPCTSVPVILRIKPSEI